MYSEFATDPKVQMLSEVDQRRFLMLLCIRCSNGNVTLQDEEVTFLLRITMDEWMQTKDNLVTRKLVDKYARPINWDKRQYVSDTSAARVRRHRERKKQALEQECNVTVTPPDTDTDTEKEKIKRKNKKFLKPTLDQVRDYCNDRCNGIDPNSFMDFYESKGWKIGKNPMADWKAAVRTWEKNQKNNSNLVPISRSNEVIF
jgi:hypothetical protein